LIATCTNMVLDFYTQRINYGIFLHVKKKPKVKELKKFSTWYRYNQIKSILSYDTGTTVRSL
jgi:hypothetical protein